VQKHRGQLLPCLSGAAHEFTPSVIVSSNPAQMEVFVNAMSSHGESIVRP